MSNAALWREVREDKHGLIGLPLSRLRLKYSLEILDQRALAVSRLEYRKNG